MKRRRFVGSAVSAALAIPLAGRVKLFAGGLLAEDVLGISPSLPVIQEWDKSTPFTIGTGFQEIWQGKQTEVIMNGTFPGVMINMQRGEELNVLVKNRLGSNTNIHWHGLDVPSNMDGHPKDEIYPAGERRYSFTVKNRAGMYFYHSHAHEATARQVYGGLYGLFRVADDEENALSLPSGDFEIPLAIQDVRKNSGYQLTYTPNMIDQMEGYLGSDVLINGVHKPKQKIKRGTYRLRLINASNARLYNIAFSDNREFNVIGSDGGLLASAVTVQSIPLGPSERYDILVDFSDASVNDRISLVSLQYSPPHGHMGTPPYPQGLPFDLIEFEVAEGVASKYNIPNVLSTFDRFDPSRAVRTRTFDLEMAMTMQMPHLINGKLFDMDTVDYRINIRDLEIWEFVNKDGDTFHPFHIHGGVFQILKRNGSTDIPQWERGWKDSFVIGPNERIEVGVQFNNHAGLFVLHCHNLEHEDAGMMANFEVVNTTDLNEEELTVPDAWYSPSADAIIVRGLVEHSSNNIGVFHMNGTLVATSGANAGGNANEIMINASSLANGAYFVNINNRSISILVSR